MAFPRPRHDIADIVRAHRPELERLHRLSRPQKRVLTDISRCRTAALGGHVEVCTGCGREHPVYNSCRNRHCPKCQAAAQQKWINARAERILPVPHFHLVFTLPSELKPVAMRHPVELYGALFQVTGEVLAELGRTHLRATLGLTLVLHTWTRDLRFHPHVHVLATAGGLSRDGSRFVHTRRDYLFPVKAMGKLLRGKMLDALRNLRRKGVLSEQGFNALMGALARHKSWVVYAKAPFRRSQHVLSYLGRYTHRVGIANSRLIDVGPGHVTFCTRGKQTATLHPVEFLRRFVQHVLPDGFHKIRHFGLYASAQGGGLLEQAKALLPAPKSRPGACPAEGTGQRCPHCGGLILWRPLMAESSRAPPAVMP